MTSPTDKAEMFARRIVSLIFEGGTKGDFDADVVEVTLILREFAASLQPAEELATLKMKYFDQPTSSRAPDKIADQLERFANWLDKLADKLGAWRAAERDRRNARRKPSRNLS